ncbi:MAG: (Fe-S)-binding protein [Cytophagaceae bacterium]
MRKKLVVDIFIPCFMDQIFPQTAFNMIRVLEKVGCEVHYNPQQTCCGQPAYNAGYFEDAREVADKFLNDFNTPNRYIVSPSASCVGMIRNSYTQLFEHTSSYLQHKRMKGNVFEFTEFLTEVLKIEKIEGARLDGTATYHDSCSALRECQIKAGPRKLLSHVEGLNLVEMKDSETCCGFGGTFAVKFEAISSGMAEQKVNHALDTRADILISTDSSCLLQIEGYLKKQKKDMKVMHIADVLASGW